MEEAGRSNDAEISACCVEFCDTQEDLHTVCSNQHMLCLPCAQGLFNTARVGLNDGETSNAMRCPLCRDSGVMEWWRQVYQAGPATPPPDSPPAHNASQRIVIRPVLPSSSPASVFPFLARHPRLSSG